MSKFTIIPAGYRFTFTSWENDGDNYNTIIKQGVDEANAQLLGELAYNISRGKTGLENIYEPSDDEKEAGYAVLWSIFKKHEALFDKKKFEEFKKDGLNMVMYIDSNILGSSSEGYLMRGLGDYKIEYLPEKITIEDVTDKFKF